MQQPLILNENCFWHLSQDQLLLDGQHALNSLYCCNCSPDLSFEGLPFWHFTLHSIMTIMIESDQASLWSSGNSRTVRLVNTGGDLPTTTDNKKWFGVDLMVRSSGGIRGCRSLLLLPVAHWLSSADRPARGTSMLDGQWNMHGWLIKQSDLRRWSSAAIPWSFELQLIRMRDERLVATLMQLHGGMYAGM